MDSRELLTLAAGVVAGILIGLARNIKAIAEALALREAAVSRRCQDRIRELEEMMGEISVTEGFSLEPTKRRETGELAALGRALSDSGAPVVAGVVCSEGQYAAVVNYSEVLGHEDVEGSLWSDPRFVAPEDLEDSQRASAESTVKINRGRRIYMKNAEGIRLPGRVYSAAPRRVGDRMMRFFLVVFDEGSVPP